MVCTNPITGTPRTPRRPRPPISARWVPQPTLRSATIERGQHPARCDGRGLLLIGTPPEPRRCYVLPGNNYHVYDYSLFWANIRADAARRLAAFEGKPQRRR